ncbi:MAG: HAD family phosphatase [Clostridiales bacterium]|nr:HAD family phosphatase [Clostridiales bacterium]
MIKNIVFDIGNVLVGYDWKRHYLNRKYPEECYEEVANAIWRSKDWDEYDRGVLSDDQITELFIKNAPGQEQLIRMMTADYHGLCYKKDYAIDWINELKGQGFKVFYLSNYSYKMRTDCADALGFIPYMDGGIMSCDVKVIKPMPEIYRLLLEKYDLKAEECVFFDDMKVNVEGAEREGFFAIHFKDKAQAEAELAELLKRE